MNILMTEANGQLGNEMRIVTQEYNRSSYLHRCQSGRRFKKYLS